MSELTDKVAEYLGPTWARWFRVCLLIDVAYCATKALT